MIILYLNFILTTSVNPDLICRMHKPFLSDLLDLPVLLIYCVHVFVDTFSLEVKEKIYLRIKHSKVGILLFTNHTIYIYIYIYIYIQ